MKRTLAETVSQLLSCIICFFKYTAGTHVSSVVAYSEFTSKSPDYVLGKAGLFSTKLSGQLEKQGTGNRKGTGTGNKNLRESAGAETTWNSQLSSSQEAGTSKDSK